MTLRLRQPRFWHAAVSVALALLLAHCSSPNTPSPPPPTGLPAPAIDSPANGADVAVRPTLTVFNVTSSEAGVKTYEFQVGIAADFASPAVTQGGVAEGTGGKTSYTLTQDLTPQTQYYWRARAIQGTLIGSWSATPSFRTGRNSPPVIKSLSARGSRANEPVNFADLDEEITVTSVVEDAETPADQLTYDWQADAGVVTGNGAIVKWRAPGSVRTPAAVTITLTARDGTGASAASATSRLVVDLHDSAKEVGDLAVEFLTNFSKSEVPATTVVKDFSSNCSGSREELSDTERNRRCFRIDSYSVGAASTRVAFGGICAFRSRPGDACTSVPVSWRSTFTSSASECAPPDGRPIGTATSVKGTDWMAAVYENSRWWLCSSDFDGSATSGAFFKH
jgi:hypothetical protein